MKLVIIGAVGYGKVVADIAELSGYTEIVFLDDNRSIKNCMGYPVVGTLDVVDDHLKSDFFVAIGNPITREKVHHMLLDKKTHLATLVHPNAVIAKNVSVGKGTVVMAGAVINSDSKIGQGCIVDTGSSIDHDNLIGNYVHVSVGSHLAGTVHIGNSTWIGAGATVSDNISICEDCMIGAGAVVIKNIEIAGTYAGVPVKKINSPYFTKE